MSNHIVPKLTGAALAIAAAGLVGCAGYGGDKAASTAVVAKTDLVHCYGVNICGGHNDCKTAANACSGHASCKGTGFVGVEMSNVNGWSEEYCVLTWTMGNLRATAFAEGNWARSLVERRMGARGLPEL